MSKDPFNSIPDVERLANALETLAEFRDPDLPGHTRRPFTRPYMDARAWLRQEMTSAGLDVTVDAAGNMSGRLAGNEELPPIIVGSHIDTVVGGGRFDGTIGVLGGLEIVRSLSATGIQLRHPLEIIDFLAEEPSDFGISTIGSRGLVGTLTDEMLARRDGNGLVLADAVRAVGGRPDDITAEARAHGSVAAYLEMHIEQGPVLDGEGIPVAAVKAIAGIRRFTIVFEGRADHAGTTPMALRADALVAAARFISEYNAIVLREEEAVGTIGYLSCAPNFPNVVVGEVELTVEMRSVEKSIVDKIEQHLQQIVQAVDEDGEVGVTIEFLTDTAPVRMDAALLKLVEEACRETDTRALTLISGAGHDASQMANIAPTGMLFVPSKEGRSHSPDEWTDMQDVAQGVQALARSLVKVDQAI